MQKLKQRVKHVVPQEYDFYIVVNAATGKSILEHN